MNQRLGPAGETPTHRRLTAVLVTCLATGVMLGAPALRADDDPRQWLDDMARAFSELSYDGIFSYFNGRELASLRVVHMVVDGEQRERLVHLNGAPREIVRRGEEVSCLVEPGDALLELEGSIPIGPFARAFVRRYDRISESYGLSFFGEDRVADRRTVRLAVTPRDDDRYGYRLWLDKQTRLLLRSELIDSEGQPMEIFQFHQIRYGDQVDAAWLEPDDKGGSLATHLTLATKQPEPLTQDQVAWRVGWLPEGFRMAAAEIRRTAGAPNSVDTLMYSDGLAAFSVYIEDMPESGAASMVSRNGATVAVTHMIHGSRQEPYLVTLVGELPTATADRIARSVAPRGDAGGGG
jgi:sigma-E factor negative regulatory protein RseB